MADRSSPALVVVAGSAGGLEAAGAFVRALPEGFAPAVVVVLHRGRRSGPDLARALAARAGRAVIEPLDKDPILGGALYLAPAGYHLLVEAGGTFALSADEPEHHCRPAADALLESAAWALGAAVGAVVVSGANHDGVAGSRAVRAGGGRVWVQSPEEAAVPVMPTAVLEGGPVDGVGPVGELARRVAEAHGG